MRVYLVNDSEGTHYCERCRENVPREEWHLSSTAKTWMHMGVLRGLMKGEPPIMCGFMDRVPGA